jgi:hypothetical protein
MHLSSEVLRIFDPRLLENEENAEETLHAISTLEQKLLDSVLEQCLTQAFALEYVLSGANP